MGHFSKETNLDNILKMMIILYKFEGYLKRHELADMLGVTHRQVSRYRDALVGIGVDIKAKPGIDGGYYIDDCPFCSKTYDFVEEFKEKIQSIEVGKKKENNEETEMTIDFFRKENYMLKKENEKLREKIKEIEKKDSKDIRNRKIIKSTLFKR